jgi:phosphoglycolate phosphatase
MIDTTYINSLEIENFIWDWNGTLLDDVEVNIRTVNDMLLKRGLSQLDMATYKEQFCFPVKTFQSLVGFDFEKEPFEEVAIEYHSTYKQYENEIKLNEDALFVIDMLYVQGANQYILSAAMQEVLITMLEDFNIADKFNGIYGVSDIHAAGKIERGNQLMKENALDPKKTLIIGDTLHDAEVAEALGINYLLYSGGHNSYELLSKNAKVINSLRELTSSINI